MSCGCPFVLSVMLPPIEPFSRRFRVASRLSTFERTSELLLLPGPCPSCDDSSRALAENTATHFPKSVANLVVYASIFCKIDISRLFQIRTNCVTEHVNHARDILSAEYRKVQRKGMNRLETSRINDQKICWS